MARSLVNPKLLQKQPALFKERCTIQVVATDVETDDETAQPWQNVDGQSGLACNVGPASNSAATANFGEEIGALAFIDLLGFMPAIAVDSQALVTFEDGTIVTYKVLAVQPDETGSSTRLVARKLNLVPQSS